MLLKKSNNTVGDFLTKTMLKSNIIVNIFTGQILTSQSSFLEILIQDFKALEDSMHRPFIYFKVL